MKAEGSTESAARGGARSVMRSREFHIALANAAVEAHSLADLASSLSGILERNVCFADQDGMLLGARSDTGDARRRERDYIVALRAAGGFRQIQDGVSPAVMPVLPEAGFGRRLGCPVRIGGGLVAIIWMDEEDDALGEPDMRAAEHAALVAALHISHQRALVSQEERLGYAFVASLLEGRFDDAPSARSRAAIAGWDPDGGYRVCLILLDEPLPLSRGGLLRLERMVLRIRQYFSRIQEPALLFVSLNQITFLLAERHDPGLLWRDLGGKGAAMAVSRVRRGAGGMASGGADVRSLAGVLKPGRIHHFDEVMFPQALLGEPAARAMLIEKRIAPLRGEKSGVLLETLEALCAEGFQLARTSRRLGVHVSTLRYRLGRMESLLNVSLASHEVRFELQVALTLTRLTEEE